MTKKQKGLVFRLREGIITLTDATLDAMVRGSAMERCGMQPAGYLEKKARRCRKGCAKASKND